MNININIIKILWEKYKFYIIIIIALLSLIFSIIFLKKINEKNPLQKIFQSISDYLFFPYPKFTGFIGNIIGNILSNNFVKFPSRLYHKLNKNNKYSNKIFIVFSKNIWPFLSNNIVDNDNDITTVIYKNYGIIFIKNNESELLNNLFNQLSSYEPLVEKIFIEYSENINYEDFQNQLKILLLNHFNRCPDINIIYSGDDNAQWNNIEGINYEFKINNIINESFNNGFLMDVNGEHLDWINSIKSIKGSISNVFLINGNNDFFLNTISENPVEYKNKNYLNFWNKIYFFLGVLFLGIGSYQFIDDYFQYKKMNNIIIDGNNILKNPNPQEQFVSAQNFLNNMNHLNPKKLKVFNKNLKKLDEYFNQVYKSSVFNIYDQKIKTIMENINNLKKFIINLQNNHSEKINELNYIHYWKKLMEEIYQLNLLLKEFKDIFNPDNIHGIYQIQERIFKITGEKNSYNNLEKLNFFIEKFTLEIKENIKIILNNIFYFILNKDLLTKKENVHQFLIKLNEYYSQTIPNDGMALLESLSSELKNFIFEINKEIYAVLDNNQWKWPSIIQEDIDFLIKNQLINDDYSSMEEEFNSKFLEYKEKIFFWDKTFLLINNTCFDRKYLLNNGNINLNNIDKSLENFLNNDLIKLVNNDFGNNLIEDYNNKLIIWDLEKLEIIESFSGLYKELMDQWNNFNGNNFFIILKKILDYKFLRTIQWFINDSIQVKKYNSNKLKEQKINFENSLKIFINMNKNIKSLNNMLPYLNNLINHQIETICKMILEFFNNLWFSKIDGNQWNGKENILKSIIGINDINQLNNIFIQDFEVMDNILNGEIIPFVKIIMDQSIILEDELPLIMNQLSTLTGQLALYKNNQDNNLKNLENQILSYMTMKNYELFKLPFKDGFSNGDMFFLISCKLHNVLVAKAKEIVEKQQISQYNNMVDFFNKKCYGKAPFCINKNYAKMEDIIELKNLSNNCQDILLIMGNNKIKYETQIQWFENINNFFKNIEIINGGIQVKFNMTLQSNDDNSSNNHLIMRWHTNLGNKQTHNINKINGVINNFDKWEILLDIVNDGSIAIIEYDKIVPIDRGCLIFSGDKWGFWQFINKYLFKETPNDIILKIKIPIVIKDEDIQQQWIVTYIKLDMIPQIKNKGNFIK
jgi:hypothetical protein